MCAFMPADRELEREAGCSARRSNSGSHAFETHAWAAAASKAWK